MCSCAATTGQMEVKAPSQTIQHVIGTTVALVIYVPMTDKTHTFCTGVWVADDRILTASHCVKGLYQMRATIQKQLHKSDSEDDDDTDDEAVIPDSKLIDLPVHYTQQNAVIAPGAEPSAIYLGKSIAIDTKHDLALISTVGNAVPYHEVAEVVKELPAVGSPVVGCGMPRGIYYTVAQGTVSSYQDDLTKIGAHYDGPFVVVGATMEYFGSSGGGIFASDGKLLGIASMLAGDIPGGTIFVRADTIRKFLDAHKSKS